MLCCLQDSTDHSKAGMLWCLQGSTDHSKALMLWCLQGSTDHSKAVLLCTAVQGLRFSCYSWAPEPRHPVHVTDVYATESRTPLVRELSADRFSVGLLLHCCPPSRVRAGEWTKVCGGQAPLWSAASAEKQRIFFLFRLQPTRHRYSLAHSTAHMSSGQSTKWHQTQ